MKSKLITTLVTIGLIGFIVVGVNNVRHSNQKIQLNEIELKSRETELIELNTKYDQVIQLKTKTEKEKQEQLKQIKELESERKRLQAELQAKAKRKADQERKLAEASQKALNAVTHTQTAYASTNGCDELRSKLSRLGVPGHELDSAIQLAMRESSCNSGAVNAESGACGEFQSYPCGKWGTPGTDQYLSNAINYAKNRYGGYNGALSHSLANNWY